MVNAFFLQLAGLRASVYFDYVPSKANIADLPSRDAISELRVELRGFRVHPGSTHTLQTPHVGRWAAPLEHWIRRGLRLPGDWPA